MTSSSISPQNLNSLPSDRAFVEQSSTDGVVGSFLQFAQVAEQVNGTAKRLEKAALLGQYFSSLDDTDLELAARYLAGTVFPLKDQRTLNIGGATLLAALAIVTGIDAETLKPQLVQLGDLGDVAAQVWITHQPPSLSLQDLALALEQLVQIKGTKRKQEWIVQLLSHATRLEAKYLIKLLSGDLRIGLREGAVEDAIARLAKEPVDRIQWVNMLLGDIGKTAVLARQGQLDQAQMELFHPIKFMLASPAEDLAEVARLLPGEFAVEDKYDGIRAQIHLAPLIYTDEASLHGTPYGDLRIALFSRTLDEITQTFPDLLPPIASFSFALTHDPQAGLILDGEIVPIENERILPFQVLQKRLGRKTLTEDLLTKIPVAFVAYDVLYQNGAILINEPYTKRLQILDNLGLNTFHLRRALNKRCADVTALDAEFLAARDRGNEGLMVKALDAPYKPGRRGKDWLKIKRAIATLDVVVTAAEVGTGRRSRFLSDFTFAVRASETDPTLLNVGKAYSGLTDAEVQQLSDWFKAHTIQEFAHGKVRTVEPKIVLEVTFDRVQPSKRHKGGYALRFPRILRIRDDKPVSEIDTLDTVKRLAELGEHES
ncbi:ATP-dependent DNA ligase [Leptolyngbya sp. FACHB-711]|uniref:ATP-dependent DNA ligase n=1 Tax=unclassified Leptolyngbya TaxID=2650499 RepID=UPI001687BCAF|nr:ATP-dependent DNA ligase [Leptolyngbya sp. FACHB-711]MBD1850908.1 ATP-dependent DNA ligase [Cyanobacteria bacterium FACHB-502]MBD2025720.1 ATP-dependent DNA ligase [Leptolyngbya sp. FACHB-711]